MTPNHGIRTLSRDIATWWRYDPHVKCLCYAHACVHHENLTLIDPFRPSTRKEWDTVTGLGRPTLIILTNGNHERDARGVQQELKIPIACGEGALGQLSFHPEIILDGKMQIHGIRPIPLPGGGPGELALFCQSQQTLFIGDALVNLKETGLTYLPDKYAADPVQLKKSIQTLAGYTFNRICFAHGEPIEANARAMLNKLIHPS